MSEAIDKVEAYELYLENNNKYLYNLARCYEQDYLDKNSFHL